MMKVTFLGTGTSQGIPVIGCHCEVCRSIDKRDQRLRTSIHLAVNGKSLVVDTGPDFRTQMLREGIEQLDALLFTHEHMDHLAGFDDIRPFCKIHQQPLSVYASNRVQQALKRAFYYVFEANKYPGVAEVNLHTIGEKPFSVGGITFQPFTVYHYYLPVLGFRVQNLTYITDASHIPIEVKNQIKGTKVLIINALRREEHISHFNLEEALSVIREIGPEKAYLIHMAHSIGKHSNVEQTLPKGVYLSYDGLGIEI